MDNPILIYKVVVTVALALLSYRLFFNRAIFFGLVALFCTFCIAYASWLEATQTTFQDSPLGKVLIKWDPLRKVINDSKAVGGNLSAEELASNIDMLAKASTSTGKANPAAKKQLAQVFAGDLRTNGIQLVQSLTNLPDNKTYAKRALTDGIRLLEKNYLNYHIVEAVNITFEEYTPEADGYEALLRLEGKFDGKTEDCRIVDYFWQESLKIPEAQLGIYGITACPETDAQ